MSVVHADLDEMVFEDRNKDYGAYQMRKKYNRFLTRAALLAFLLFLFATGLPKMVRWLGPKEEVVEKVQEITAIEMELLDEPLPEEEEQIEEPPPPPPEMEMPPPAAVAQIEFQVIEPAPEEEVDPDETIREIEEVVEADTALIGNQDVEGIADDGTGDIDWDGLAGGTGEPQEVKAVDDDPDPNAFIIAEEQPRPVNIDDIKKLIGYPTMAREAEIEGKVVVRVLVDKTGRYKKHIVLKDPHPILTKAVESKLKKLQFTPGVQAGKPIKVWVTIPFDFKLQR